MCVHVCVLRLCSVRMCLCMVHVNTYMSGRDIQYRNNSILLQQVEILLLYTQ